MTLVPGPLALSGWPGPGTAPQEVLRPHTRRPPFRPSEDHYVQHPCQVRAFDGSTFARTTIERRELRDNDVPGQPATG